MAELVKAKLKLLILLVLLLSLSSCTTTNNARILGTESSQVQLRQIQTRAFDSQDITGTLRTIIATMQDLGFVIDKADHDLGTVSATKLEGYALKMTATVRPRGTHQLLVRVSAQYDNSTVVDPEPYQDFFVALEKAMFLSAQQVY